MFFANVEDGVLTLHLRQDAGPPKLVGSFNPSDVVSAGQTIYNYSDDWTESCIMCSSSVDFAGEYGWPEASARGFVRTAQQSAHSLHHEASDWEYQLALMERIHPDNL
tara:strand:- start:178 stop:501 length:324 start_codon:yes stop_codon:yes gene_type:complete